MRKIYPNGNQSQLFDDDENLKKEGQASAARPDDHRTTPMSEITEEFELKRSFSKVKMDLIKYGFIPPSMDYKWFMYYINETLFIHRSWTGYCIFKVVFKENKNGSATADKLIINRAGEEYHGPPAVKCWIHVQDLIKQYLIDGVTFDPDFIY